MTHFDISIVSDTVCPWCYVGKKRLEKGIASYKAMHPDSKVTFSITWLPFYLDPSAPRSISKQERYLSRIGSAERVELMRARMSKIGEQEGINFKWGGMTGNTRDSHRLVQLGKTKGSKMQTRVIEELFKGSFEEEADITTQSVLTRLGVRAGLDESEVEEWLKSGKGGKEVDMEVGVAAREGISGVPFFTVNGKYALEGAQDPEAFVQVFERIGRAQAANEVARGDGC